MDSVACNRVDTVTRLSDLPPEIVELIASHLAPDGRWNHVNYAIRDHAALAMSGRAMLELARALGDRISATLGTENRGEITCERPVPPPRLTFPSDVTKSSPVSDVRAASRAIGVVPARSRAGTISRVGSAIAERERLIAETVSAAESYREFPPVPRNPVPPHMRPGITETPRMTRKVARAQFGLTETDLRYAPVKLVQVVRCGAPMRLYEVRVLCSLALDKFGSVRETDEATRGRPKFPARESLTVKRDTECEKVRTLVMSRHPSQIESRAWSEVVKQNRASPRMLSRCEMARRWYAEIAVAGLSSRDRRLIMLGRRRYGAPDAHKHADLLEGLRRRDDIVAGWGGDRASVFWECVVGELGFWEFKTEESARENSVACVFTFERLRSKNRRFSELCQLMDARGVEVRADLPLCRSYVNDQRFETLRMLDRIVDATEETVWLSKHEELQFSERARRLIDEGLDELKRKFREQGAFYGMDDTLKVRGDACIVAQRQVCQLLVDDPDLRQRVSPLPRYTRARIEEIEELAREELAV